MASSSTFTIQGSFAGLPAQAKRSSRTTVTCAATAAPPQSGVLRSARSSTLYDVLGVKSGATCREIKAAYRRLVLEFHPDIVPDDQKAESASEFIRIHDAYATLSDPEKKADYDKEMMFAALATAGRRQWASQSSAPPRSYQNYRNSQPFSNRAPRTWETDQCW